MDQHLGASSFAVPILEGHSNFAQVATDSESQHELGILNTRLSSSLSSGFFYITYDLIATLVWVLFSSSFFPTGAHLDLCFPPWHGAWRGRGVAFIGALMIPTTLYVSHERTYTGTTHWRVSGGFGILLLLSFVWWCRDMFFVHKYGGWITRGGGGGLYGGLAGWLSKV